MSTIPRRPVPSQAKTRKRPAGRGEASFDYGYRLVRRKGLNGQEGSVRIPLTLWDVLHPQEGDVHMLSDPHVDDCTYFSRRAGPRAGRHRGGGVPLADQFPPGRG
jgi:hypothetical protein